MSQDLLSSQEEKYLIERLLGSADSFVKCLPFLNEEHFDDSYKKVVKFIIGYYNEYSILPKVDHVNARFFGKETENLKTRTVSRDEANELCKTTLNFCKMKAAINVVLSSYEKIKDGEYGKLINDMNEVVSMTLDTDFGTDFLKIDEEYLHKLIDQTTPYSSGIVGIDTPLDGGLRRKTFTLFSGNSGTGKSLIMNNIGLNMNKLNGLHVVYFSLELPESMVSLRSASISTGVSTKSWKDSIPKIVAYVKKLSQRNEGSFIIKRLPFGATANHLKAYLKTYYSEFNRNPDLIIIDYLDIMHPNGGIKNISVSEQDKQKTEEVVEILHELDAIGISASQQTREALRMAAPDQAVVAGGITKVNTVDNYLSIYMTPQMRLTGDMMIHCLKSRSSAGVGIVSHLSFNSNCLQITDKDAVAVKMQTLAQRRENSDKLLGEMVKDGYEIEPKLDQTNLGLPNVEFKEIQKTEIDILFEQEFNNSSEVAEPISESKDFILDEGIVVKDNTCKQSKMITSINLSGRKPIRRK